MRAARGPRGEKGCVIGGQAGSWVPPTPGYSGRRGDLPRTPTRPQHRWGRFACQPKAPSPLLPGPTPGSSSTGQDPHGWVECQALLCPPPCCPSALGDARPSALPGILSLAQTGHGHLHRCPALSLPRETPSDPGEWGQRGICRGKLPPESPVCLLALNPRSFPARALHLLPALAPCLALAHIVTSQTYNMNVLGISRLSCGFHSFGRLAAQQN